MRARQRDHKVVHIDDVVLREKARSWLEEHTTKLSKNNEVQGYAFDYKEVDSKINHKTQSQLKSLLFNTFLLNLNKIVNKEDLKITMIIWLSSIEDPKPKPPA